MKIDTKFKYKGDPVIITGGSFVKVDKYISAPLAIQARITYENGDSGYVSFEDLENIDPISVEFKISHKKNKQ